MRMRDTIPVPDEDLLEVVHHALQRRRPRAVRRHGRPGTPAEVVAQDVFAAQTHS